MSDTNPHISVLLNEVIKVLNIKDNGVYIDATFGAGGYTKQILKSAKNVKVIAFDRDKTVSKYAEQIKSEYKDNFTFINDKFSNIPNHINYKVDGIVFDIGVSSMQIDNAERGFSYRFNNKLDMRMDQNSKLSAFDIVNKFNQDEISDIIYKYSDEKKSKLIAKKIVEERLTKQIETTFDLISIIEKCVSPKHRLDTIKRVFQALRIAVNDELNELKISLNNSISLLKSEGVLAVVTFHSLEDKIVKNFLKPKSNVNRFSIESITNTENKEKSPFKIIQKKCIIPSDEELELNPRSASSKLRYAIKI